MIALLALGALVVTIQQVWADPGQGRLFASDPNRSDLLEIQTATGRGFFLRDVALPAGGLAVDVRDATADALYLGQGVGASKLYVLDASTDTVRLVGDSGLGAQATLHGLDFVRRDATTDAFSFPATLPSGKPAPGRLLAALNLVGSNASGADHLAELSLANGHGVVIGSFGVDGVEALAFDPEGTLWAAVGAAGGATPGLYTVEVDSGLATFYATLSNVGSNGPPGAPSGGLTALQFACDGTLYGGTGMASSSAWSEQQDQSQGKPGNGSTGKPGGGPTPSKGGPLGGGSSAAGGLASGSGGTAPSGGTGETPQGPGQGAATAHDGGRLVTIDPVTGHFTYAGARAVSGGDLGGFAFGDACLTLFAPVPGFAGANNTLDVLGATPGGPLRLFAGRAPGATAVALPGCGVVTLGLADAKPRSTAPADGQGEATLTVPIPGGLRNATVYFQAIDRASCTVSNVGALRFR